MSDLCGFKHWHPNWMQKLASTKTFVLVYGFLGTVQAMAFVYFSNTMTTMERRFEIPSSIIGLILCGNEVSQILLSLVLSYLGGRQNRPRWIGWGVLFSALSCFVLALPHFLYGAGDKTLRLTSEYLDDQKILNVTVDELVRTKNRLCIPNSVSEDHCTLPQMTPLLLIFFSQLILGVGSSLYYSLGQSYLDDNVEKTRTPFLLGIALSLRMLGPILGFILGYVVLQVFVDPTKTPTITNQDPRWLGAWWLGWLFLGCLMSVFALLIGLFPKNLKKAAARAEEAQLSLRDFGSSFGRLVRSKLLVFNSLSMVFYLLGSNGYIIFLSKYIEVLFQKSPSEATIITGPVTLFGMALGFMLSGWVITSFKPAAGKVLFWNVIVGLLVLSGEFFNLFLSCPDSETIGPHMQTCNSHCLCDRVPYTPVCDRDTTYFSPCHAACESWNAPAKLYESCGCTTGESASSGACLGNCDFGYYAFIATAAIYNFFGASGRIGNTLVNYRCIDRRDKAFAQGFILTVTSLFGLIPAPIIFGKIIDSTCLIWSQECGHHGACLAYDRRSFRYSFNLVAMLFTALGVTFDYLVWKNGRHLKVYSEPDGMGEAKELERRGSGD